MKRAIDSILRITVEKCFDKGKLKRTPLPDYVIEVPGNHDHGHFATNLALSFASLQKQRPQEIAKTIVDNMVDENNLIEKVEIAGPGFINFMIKAGEWYRALMELITSGEDYGRSDLGRGESVLVEFVSANPTGPLHIGHGRCAAFGDTLCRILSFCGYDVVREFYVNDAGLQIKLLGESIFSRWRQISDPDSPFPEKGYHGGYVEDLAREIADEVNLSELQPEEAIGRCAEWGEKKMLGEIKSDLSDFRIRFDVWSHEKDIYSTGLLEESLERMREKGELYTQDGALWIKTSVFGDDKDRVIRKSDGEYTYFASDISYHLKKWERGFSKAVNIWGADHHGYVQRMRASLKANGINETWLSVLLIQLVKLWKGGQELRMSKRSGHYVTLKELIEEVGVDAVRFIFLTKNHDSPLDFDIDLVTKQSSENPVYYVQYAHARICSIFRKAVSEGITLPKKPDQIVGQLVLDEEMALIRLLTEFPSLLEDISITFEAHRLTYYLTELAASFHRYFNLGTKTAEKRIVTSNKPLSQARLLLAQAIRTVIYNGLTLLGINAPERM
jgi:arginyl-tRNA synthetase